MKRSTFWRLLLLGYLLAFGVIGWTAYSLIANTPAPAVAQGAFRCDQSWRLPCDGVR